MNPFVEAFAATSAMLIGTIAVCIWIAYAGICLEKSDLLTGWPKWWRRAFGYVSCFFWASFLLTVFLIK